MLIVDWYVSAAKGLWFGIYNGFFKDKFKPDSRCLSTSVHSEVQTVMQFFAWGELGDIFHVADSLSTLYFDTKNYCGETLLKNAIHDHCAQVSCEPKALFKNAITKHLLEVTSSIGMMEQLWYQQSLIDMEADDVFAYTLQMGHEIGNIVGRSIDY